MTPTDRDLEDRLSAPSPDLVEGLSRLDGDLVVLGAGGKMGPSLSVMARRALDAAGRVDVAVHAVSRWSDVGVRSQLEEARVRTVSADLLAADSYVDLPDASAVVFMVGAKFGTAAHAGRLWQTNSVVPGFVASRYRDARMAGLSTGNVYPMVAPETRGCDETTPLSPVGEYAMSCLGRERVLAFAAEQYGIPMSIIRLNYAVDLRYGVLADIVSAVAAGDPVDVSTGWVNVVWQRYANEVVLRSIEHASTEAFVLNLTGSETLGVRELAHRAGELLGVAATVIGQEQPTALLNDASKCHRLFGDPDVDATVLTEWQVDWIRAGGTLWGKPTKFQVRDGRF